MVIKYRDLVPWGKYWGILDKYPATYGEYKRLTFFDPITLVPLNTTSRSPIKRKIMKELGIINPKASFATKWVKLTQDFLLIGKKKYLSYSLEFYSRKTRKKFLIIEEYLRDPVVFKDNIIFENPLLNLLISISINFLKELEKNDKITKIKTLSDQKIKGIMRIKNISKFGSIEKMFEYKDGLYIRTPSYLLNFKSLGEDLGQLQPEIIHSESQSLEATMVYYQFGNFFAECKKYKTREIIVTNLDTKEVYIYKISEEKLKYVGMCIGHGYIFLFLPNGLVKVRDLLDFSLVTEFRLILDRHFNVLPEKEENNLSFKDPQWSGKVLYIIGDNSLIKIDFSKFLSKCK